MDIKLKDGVEVGMYYECKEKNMSEKDIQLAIQLLRAICEMK